MHRLLHLDVREQTYANHSVNVDYQEHQAANVDQRRQRVDEGSKDYLQLFQIPEQFEDPAHSQCSHHLRCSLSTASCNVPNDHKDNASSHYQEVKNVPFLLKVPPSECYKFEASLYSKNSCEYIVHYFNSSYSFLRHVGPLDSQDDGVKQDRDQNKEFKVLVYSQIVAPLSALVSSRPSHSDLGSHLKHKYFRFSPLLLFVC